MPDSLMQSFRLKASSIVSFHSGAYCQDIDAASPLNAIVNKNSLENGGLIGAGGFIPTLQNLLSKLETQKFDSDISL